MIPCFNVSGPLLQVLNEKTKSSRNRLGSFSSSFKEKKEIVRQVFLFTNHILLTTRTSSGRLHLAKVTHILAQPSDVLFSFFLACFLCASFSASLLALACCKQANFPPKDEGSIPIRGGEYSLLNV